MSGGTSVERKDNLQPCAARLHRSLRVVAVSAPLTGGAATAKRRGEAAAGSRRPTSLAIPATATASVSAFSISSFFPDGREVEVEVEDADASSNQRERKRERERERGVLGLFVL